MSSWRTLKITDLCAEIIDCVNKTAVSVDYITEFRMVRTPNVSNGFINLEDSKCVEKSVFERWSRGGRQLIKNDIVLTREAPLGNVGIFLGEEKAFLGQRTVIYRPNLEACDPFFLLASFLSSDVQGQIQAFGSGATVAHMRVPDAKELLISAPDIKEQRAIGEIFKHLFEIIRTNEKRIEALKTMSDLLYRKWFIDFKVPGYEALEMVDSGHPDWGLIPSGWRLRRYQKSVTSKKARE